MKIPTAVRTALEEKVEWLQEFIGRAGAYAPEAVNEARVQVDAIRDWLEIYDTKL